MELALENVCPPLSGAQRRTARQSLESCWIHEEWMAADGAAARKVETLDRPMTSR